MPAPRGQRPPVCVRCGNTRFMKDVFLLLFFCILSVPCFSDEPLIQQAQQILREVPLIDGHNDLPWKIHETFKNHLGSLWI